MEEAFCVAPARPLYAGEGGEGGHGAGGGAAAPAAAVQVEEAKPFYATAAPAFWSYYYDAKAETRQLGQTHPCLSPTSTCNIAQRMEQQQQQDSQQLKQIQEQQQLHKQHEQKQRQQAPQQRRQVQQHQEQQMHQQQVQQPLQQVNPRWFQQEMEDTQRQKALNALLAQSLYESIKENYPYILQTQYNYGYDNQGNIWRAYGYFPVPFPRRYAQPYRN